MENPPILMDFPRHPSGPVRYLDPPNLPKPAPKEIFGRLGGSNSPLPRSKLPFIEVTQLTVGAHFGHIPRVNEDIGTRQILSSKKFFEFRVGSPNGISKSTV